MASPLFMLRGAFRHPERSEMSDVRSCKGGTVRTESKDLAPHHHFGFLISNFSFKRRFQTESKGSTPQRLTLNPPAFPIFLLHFALNPAIILTYMYKQRWEEAGKFLTESRRGWKGGRKETAGHPGADSEICPRRTLRANERSVTDYLGGTAEALFRPMWMKEIFLL